MKKNKTSVISRINELQHLDWEYCLKLERLVGIIYNQMELLRWHTDQSVSEIALQTQDITAIIKDQLDTFDFELVEDIRKLANP